MSLRPPSVLLPHDFAAVRIFQALELEFIRTAILVSKLSCQQFAVIPPVIEP